MYIPKLASSVFKSFSNSPQSKIEASRPEFEKRAFFPERTDYIYPSMQNIILAQALSFLSDVEFCQEDKDYVTGMGADIVYESGKDALNFLKKNDISIKFAPLHSKENHAQYVNKDKTILINDRYSYTRNFGDILAISEAIFHEAVHAKDKDDLSSLQEEFDALAMNVLANRYHCKKYPFVFETSYSDIIHDGVLLYSNLFFDEDPKKSALLKRIDEKYGELSLESPNHTIKEGSILTYFKNNLSRKFAQ